MRQKHAFIPTLRTVGEAEMISHQFLLRAGMIRQLAAGIYNYLPIAQRVLRKIEQIVREEMDAINGQELLLPALHPAELWEESGRYQNYGPELVKLNDRHQRPFVMGPTHEEVITDLIRNDLNSYKKLPITLYQIQTKFRDERRPRSGLLRGREFIMKDAYSFHADRDSLDKTYQDMYQAYVNIFTRCGLDFRAVEADSGAIGGKGTHEFMVLAESGEDTVVTCNSCDYAANIEMAEVVNNLEKAEPHEVAPLEKIATPGVASIADLAEFLQLSADKLVKTMILLVDQEPVMVLLRGDHEVNDVKVKNLLDAAVVEMADEKTILEVCGGPAGFLGPVGLKKKIKVLADQALLAFSEYIIGANEKDAHYLHAQEGRDFQVDQYADLRNVQEGDVCPRCGGEVSFTRGIEVGHIFKLGTRYSDTMKATFLDQHGKEKPFIMGCYGIGVSRVLAAVIEQSHDANGIIWPVSIAPYQVHVIAVNTKDETQLQVAEGLYEELRKAGYEVLLDDREERAGVKFKDADLIGIPVRVIVGSKAKNGVVELKLRRTGETAEIGKTDLLEYLPNWLQKAGQKK